MTELEQIVVTGCPTCGAMAQAIAEGDGVRYRHIDAATLRQPSANPHFTSPESLAEWLESLHECYPDGAVGNRKWEAAQVAAKAIRTTLRQSADSGRVGDELVERAAKAMWEVVPRGVPWSDEVTSADDWRMLARAALAAQGQGEVDLRKYVRHLADALEAGVGMWKVDADLQRLAAAINANHPAPAASPAGVPDGRKTYTRADVTAWRDNAFESAAKIVDRYAEHLKEITHAADDIRALKSAPSAPEGDGGEG